MNEIKRTLIKQAISVTLSLVSFVVIMFFAISYSNAWFSFNEKVSTSGMMFSTSTSIPVILKSTIDGDDIGVAEISEETVHIENTIDDGDRAIQPGSSGKFTFYLEYNPSNNSENHTFNISLKVVNNYFRDENHGFFENKDGKIQDQTNSVEYINSHLMFFRSKSNEGVYSDWIRSEEVFSSTLNESESKHVLEETVYWVWVSDYSFIFGAGCDIIDASDISEIKSYYLMEENKSKIFQDGNVSEDGYNMADYVIGTTLQYICFEMELS